MLSIRSSADMALALSGPLDPALRALLIRRRDQLLDGEDLELGDLVQFVVVGLGDTADAIEAEAGFALTVDPPFEWVERHGRWLEAPIVTNDDGFAVTLLVPDCIGVDPALLFALLAHA